MTDPADPSGTSITARRRFWHVAASGAAFQGGSAAVDSSTIVAALIFQLTGSPVAVGAVPAILRLGWLAPQIFVGYLAGKGRSAMRFYAIGAFGRTAAIATLAGLLLLGAGAGWPAGTLGMAALVLWTIYAFVSGIVGVPYNDVVARAVPSARRSRLLALRFFGGGLVALAVAALSDLFLKNLDFPISYSAVFGIAAVLMLASSAVFVAMGDPAPAATSRPAASFAHYLSEGVEAFRRDAQFSRFVLAQWCGAAVLIAAPFYVVAAAGMGLELENIALLLAAQTAGSLVSNLAWGWWGDARGKLSLMRVIAGLRLVPPLILLGLAPMDLPAPWLLFALAVVFALLGALTSGLTIAVIGLLMEISPDDRRLAYSGYFNAMTAPAFLLPLLGGAIYTVFGSGPVFLASAIAAVAQAGALQRMKSR